MSSWLRHAQPALEQYESGKRVSSVAATHNQVGQLNVLLQLEHLRSYPFVREAEAEGRLKLHAWWFDIAAADVYEWRPRTQSFVLVDEHSVQAGDSERLRPSP
jgi:carbonic anhydrase